MTLTHSYSIPLTLTFLLHRGLCMLAAVSKKAVFSIFQYVRNEAWIGLKLPQVGGVSCSLFLLNHTFNVQKFFEDKKKYFKLTQPWHVKLVCCLVQLVPIRINVVWKDQQCWNCQRKPSIWFGMAMIRLNQLWKILWPMHIRQFQTFELQIYKCLAK